MKPQQNIYRVLESFDFYTQDIEKVLEKSWLKTAIVSHITKDLCGHGIPKSFVKKTVDLIYLSAHI